MTRGGGESTGEKVHCLARSETVDENRAMMAGEGKTCSSEQNQLQDSSDSDLEPEGVPATAAAVAAGGTGRSAGSFRRCQVIHSGHFMVSSPHSDSAPRRRKSGAALRYDFDTVNRTWCQTYRFGPFSTGSLSIDPTLTRLFECMSLAYRWVFPRADPLGSVSLVFTRKCALGFNPVLNLIIIFI